MSIKKVPERISRTEMRVFLIRKGMSGKQFCETEDLNYHTFSAWMSGDDRMPHFEARLKTIIEGYDYPIDLLIEPGLRMQIEAATV